MVKARVRFWWGLAALASGFGVSCNSSRGSDTPPPACNAPLPDQDIEPPWSAAQGTFIGSDVQMALRSGAVARLEQTTASIASSPRLFMDIDGVEDQAHGFEIAVPGNATRGGLGVFVQIGAAQPGTYTETGACGFIVVCVALPVPALDCSSGLQGTCPEGCSLQGPAFGPTCAPNEPTVCYEAASDVGDCLVAAGSSGSWSLHLTSVEPYVAPDGGSDSGFFFSHGSLTATLVELPSSLSTGTPNDAGLPTATLELTF